MKPDCFNSYLEIDMHILRENIRSVASVLPNGTQLIPVLKGDAYGLGAVKVASEIIKAAEIKTFAVAQIGEALQLRNAGINQDTLVLGAFPMFQLPLAVENGLILTVFDVDTVREIECEAARQGRCVRVHIKIETGLNRIGVKPGEALSALTDTLKTLPHIEVTGCFTHFIDGEKYYSPLAVRQLELFKKAVSQLRDFGFDVPLCHICNSGASEWFEEAMLNGVRIGRRLYMDSRDYPHDISQPGAVGEVASWRTSIVNLHDVTVGESVGYDETFIAARPTTVATICVGYGDGLCTDFVRAGSPCLVNGQTARYIGICMDQSFLDVTGIDCRIGDEVTVFGRSSDGAFLSAQVLAKTVAHEGVFFTDCLGNRVGRRYING